jgi:hypothetical protein
MNKIKLFLCVVIMIFPKASFAAEVVVPDCNQFNQMTTEYQNCQISVATEATNQRQKKLFFRGFLVLVTVMVIVLVSIRPMMQRQFRKEGLGKVFERSRSYESRWKRERGGGRQANADSSTGVLLREKNAPSPAFDLRANFKSVTTASLKGSPVNKSASVAGNVAVKSQIPGSDPLSQVLSKSVIAISELIKSRKALGQESFVEVRSDCICPLNRTIDSGTIVVKFHNSYQLDHSQLIDAIKTLAQEEGYKSQLSPITNSPDRPRVANQTWVEIRFFRDAAASEEVA